MLKINKYRNLMLAIILTSLVAIIQGADEPAIDINEITKSNPFMQFTPNQNRAPIGAAITVKPDLFVETATLKFLDAKSVKASISSMSGEYGSMEPDSKGNTLIICDTNDNLEKILEQIRKIDRKPGQVMIEVVLLDVKLNNETELGINWDLLTTNDHEAVFRQNLGFSNRLQSTIRNSANIGSATAFNTGGTGSDLWLLFGGDIRSVIHAIQEKNNVEILASPRVMVVSGQSATIESVEEIPYSEQSQTSEGGALTSTKFKNVGVMLKVGATLTDDKFILLDIETEQNAQTATSSVEGVAGTPIVDTRKVQSSLLLEDGQILVIGGLRRKDTQKQTNQLPILGDLPIVGLAFKSTKTTENNSELLIILSPHIYAGEKPTELQMQKYNEITQRPLLAIPEADERREKEKKQESEKRKKEKEAKKAKKLSKK